jgi:hypothetical protein
MFVKLFVPQDNYNCVGFEILTTVAMKSSIFFDIIPFRLVKIIRRFEGTHRLHLQSRRVGQTKKEHELDESKVVLVCS